MSSMQAKADMQSLFSDPGAFIYRTVIKDFGGPHKICSGVIYDHDEDNLGNTLWGIQWGDGTKGDFNVNEMRKFCVLNSDGIQPDQTWQSASVSDVAAVQARLDDLKMAYFTTKNQDTWSKICSGLDLVQGHRKLYYEWISKYRGYGAVKHDDDDVPWMKFLDPYSTARPRVTTKFQQALHR